MFRYPNLHLKRCSVFVTRLHKISVFPLSKGAVCQAWEHLRTRAGSQDLRFHDLRHEAVTRLLERGFNVIETATISGHKELRMLQRYSHLRAVDLVERLG